VAKGRQQLSPPAFVLPADATGADPRTTGVETMTITTNAIDKALEHFNLLMEARNDLLPAVFEAKAKVDAARTIVNRLAEFPDELIDDGAFDIINEERMDAEHELNLAISAMVERDTAMWDAHAEFRRLHDAAERAGRPKKPTGSRRKTA
jgi:hypothetical protein